METNHLLPGGPFSQIEGATSTKTVGKFLTPPLTYRRFLLLDPQDWPEFPLYHRD